MNRATALIVLAALAGGAVAAPAAAEGRDPAYAAARAAGQVGERPNGYLGLVGAADPALRHMVDALNIKRKAVYAERAQAQGSTIEAYAIATACHLIDQTEPGEKYQAPDGSWQTRGAGAPLKDSRCP